MSLLGQQPWGQRALKIQSDTISYKCTKITAIKPEKKSAKQNNTTSTK